MKSDEVIERLQRIRQFYLDTIKDDTAVEAVDMAIKAVEKQEQSCETCKHGRFGDEACINCRVGFPSHYETEEKDD